MASPPLPLPLLLVIIVTITLLPNSSSSLSLSSAIEALSSSPNLSSITLTLTLTHQTLIPTSTPSLTLFIPTDPAFLDSGQPSLSVLRYHLSPSRLGHETLASLPFGSKIGTLDPDRSLTVTTSAYDPFVSINGVGIGGSAAFDDGSVVAYMIARFFDPSFNLSSFSGPSFAIPGPIFKCTSPATTGSFTRAPNKIRSIGYSLVASFLDLQLAQSMQLIWNQSAGMTIFAPLDESIKGLGGNFSDYAEVFRRHVVPCRIVGGDLERLSEGTVLPTLEEGFEISVDQAEDRALLNGVPVEVSDLYADGLVVVHGVRDVLKPLDTLVEFG